MINGNQTKEAQLRDNWFQHGTGPLKILLLFPCRGIFFLNYLADLNVDNQFTIFYVDPVNWGLAERQSRETWLAANDRLRVDRRFTDMLASAHWFIHERYVGHEMFSTESICRERIYDHGLHPELDITIPNFHDHLILFNDVIKYSPGMKERAMIDMRSNQALSEWTQNDIVKIGQGEIVRFGLSCRMSSLPDMEGFFESEWTKQRLFWAINHISAAMAVKMFRMANDSFLKLDVPDHLWTQWLADPSFSTPCSIHTRYDVEQYGVSWPQPVGELSL